jgi:hypothetical protein
MLSLLSHRGNAPRPKRKSSHDLQVQNAFDGSNRAGAGGLRIGTISMQKEGLIY